MENLIFGLLISMLIGFCSVEAEAIDMKVVEEPSSLGYQNSYGNLYAEEEELKLKVQPANFSGPVHFSRLIGRCFHTVIQNYKYSFCPYSNITQHEQDIHWNPYKGVLGVWQEWEVKDNRYVAMLMKEGDTCGEISRSVKVLFECGNHSQVMNASEPHRCSYELRFKTPLVCDSDAMLVYPSLAPSLRHQWDLLEGEMEAGDLTESGYNRRLRSIFAKAGIYLTLEKKKTLAKKVEPKVDSTFGGFTDLYLCNAGYKSLREQNEALRHQLSLLNYTNPV